MVEKRPNWEKGSVASYCLVTKKFLLIMLRVAVAMMTATTTVVTAIIDGSSIVLTTLSDVLSSDPLLHRHD